MKHPLPTRPELGVRDGLAYALFLPETEPRAGVVILHGAGSAKESHFDFARTARDRGLAALAYDARGHGRSDGAFGPGAIEDVLAMCALLGEHAPALAVRGSSLGGFCADEPGLERWLEAVSVRDAAASLGPRTVLLLMHARGDEQVPYTVSEDLHSAAAEPKRLLVI